MYSRVWACGNSKSALTIEALYSSVEDKHAAVYYVGGETSTEELSKDSELEPVECPACTYWNRSAVSDWTIVSMCVVDGWTSTVSCGIGNVSEASC